MAISFKNYILNVILYITQRIRLYLSPVLLEYAPDGWKTVLKQKNSSGWNAGCVVKAESAKWEEFCSRVSSPNPLGFYHEHSDLSICEHVPFHNIYISFSYVLALVSRQKSKLTILDYGGSLGHYYQIAASVIRDLELDYHCKELPSIAEAGKILNPNITWYTDDSCLKRSYDLVLISSSLQYIASWKEFLHSIADSVADYLYLARINVQSSCPEFVAIQNIYDTQMLVIMFYKEELLKEIKNCGLSLVREFVMEDCPLIKNAPTQCVMRGWLFRKTDRHNKFVY